MTKLKVLFLLTTIGLFGTFSQAQRSVRIGYIDTEYILENIPDYQAATSQLDQKVEKWKLEIETKLKSIEQKKQQLENESVLLTKELFDERFEDISFEESEILEYQQKRFGPNGDLMIQKQQLMQPIQDQIYAAVQELAEKRSYDFIFDKNSDFLMLYSAERYDISDIVLRTITRASRKENAVTPDQRRALREEEALDSRSFEEIERETQAAERQATNDSILLDRRAQREADLAERKRLQQEARDAKKRETEARRQKAEEQRNGGAKTADSTSTNVSSSAPPKASDEKNSDSTSTGSKTLKTGAAATTEKTAAQLQEERRQLKLKEREDRRKELEERKKKILEQRKKAREEREAKARRADSIAKARKQGKTKEGETENEENENKENK